MTGRIGASGLLAIVLAAVIAALAWVIVDGQTRSVPAAVGVAPDLTGPGEAIAAVAPAVEISPEAIAVIAERPVFSPARRPVEKAAVVAPRRQDRPPSIDFALVGIVATDERRFVLVTEPGSDETVQLGEGDAYRDWIVAEIGSGYVVLQSADYQERLTLSYRPP